MPMKRYSWFETVRFNQPIKNRTLKSTIVSADIRRSNQCRKIDQSAFFPTIATSQDYSYVYTCKGNVVLSLELFAYALLKEEEIFY
jgi:hypothetical protein